MENTKTVPSLAWVLLIILSVIWGSSFMLMKLGLDTFTPLQITALRLAIAGLCLTPFLFRYLKEVNLKQGLMLAFIGITGNGLPAFLFVTAEQVIPTAVAGVLNALTPIFTVILAVLFFKAKFPLQKVMGIVVGLVGTIVLVTVGSAGLNLSQNLQYSLLIVGATMCYAISVNLIQAYFKSTSPTLVTTFALVSLAVPSLIYLVMDADFMHTMESHPKAWESFGYIALLGAVGTSIAVILFYKMLQISNILFASSVTYTIPVVAVSWGILFLHEDLGWQHFLGFSIILAGVYLTNRKKA